MGLRDHLDTCNVPGATIDAILVSLDRFFGFLGLGPVRPGADLPEVRQT
jgi:hypothetical protein